MVFAQSFIISTTSSFSCKNTSNRMGFQRNLLKTQFRAFEIKYWIGPLCVVSKWVVYRRLRPTAHRCNKMRRDEVSPSPLPHTITDLFFAHRDIHVTPHTESMRFVWHQSNRTMLSQNVTCCIFGATCDRFVSPIKYIKYLCTLLREVDSAVSVECLSGYRYSVLVMKYIIKIIRYSIYIYIYIYIYIVYCSLFLYQYSILLQKHSLSI